MKIVFGCGYVGFRVARRWVERGDRVVAVTRSPVRADEFRAAGIDPRVGDLTDPTTTWDLPAADTVLFAVGYDRRGGQSIDDVYVGGLQRALDAIVHRPDRFLYVSSTGVYSQNDGQWVDEDSETAPTRAGGQACLAAEQLLAAHPTMGSRRVVLRLAGIYGPDRVPRLDAIRRGEELPVVGEGYLNLIHVDDAVAVILAAAERAVPPELLLVADGQPVVRRQYLEEIARLLDAPPPRLTTAPVESPQAVRAAADKRISTARLRERLNVPLQFPTYREGLAAILSSGETC